MRSGSGFALTLQFAVVIMATVPSVAHGNKDHRVTESCVGDSDCGGYPEFLCVSNKCFERVLIPSPEWEGEHCKQLGDAVYIEAHSQCSAIMEISNDSSLFSGHLTIDALTGDTATVGCSFETKDNGNAQRNLGIVFDSESGDWRFQTQQSVDNVVTVNCSVVAGFENATLTVVSLFGDLKAIDDSDEDSANSSDGCNQAVVGTYTMLAILSLMTLGFFCGVGFEKVTEIGTKPMRVLPFVVCCFDFWADINLNTVLWSVSGQLAVLSALFLALNICVAFGLVAFMPKFLKRYAPTNKSVRYRYAEGIEARKFATFASVCGSMHAALELFNSRVFAKDITARKDLIAAYLRCDDSVDEDGINAQFAMGLTDGELQRFAKLRFTPIATSTVPHLIIALIALVLSDCNLGLPPFLSLASGVLSVIVAKVNYYNKQPNASEAQFRFKLVLNRKRGAAEKDMNMVADVFTAAKRRYRRMEEHLSKVMQVDCADLNVGWIESDYEEVKAHVGLRFSNENPPDLAAINARLNDMASSGELEDILMAALNITNPDKALFEFKASVWCIDESETVRLLHATTTVITPPKPVGTEVQGEADHVFVNMPTVRPIQQQVLEECVVGERSDEQTGEQQRAGDGDNDDHYEYQAGDSDSDSDVYPEPNL